MGIPSGETLEREMLFQAAKGERFRNQADAWIERNPQAWEYMRNAARRSAAMHKRFGIQSLCEHVRWKMMLKGDTGFKLNNNYAAAFARRLIKEVPECEPYINPRHSVCDA